MSSHNKAENYQMLHKAVHGINLHTYFHCQNQSCGRGKFFTQVILPVAVHEHLFGIFTLSCGSE